MSLYANDLLCKQGNSKSERYLSNTAFRAPPRMVWTVFIEEENATESLVGQDIRLCLIREIR